MCRDEIARLIAAMSLGEADQACLTGAAVATTASTAIGGGFPAKLMSTTAEGRARPSVIEVS